jgi:hypothetical protein
MHTTCFDQHWSSSGVSKIVPETAALPSVSARDAIRGTTPRHRTYRRINEGISQKWNLRTEAQQFHQKFYRPEDDQYWSKHVVCIHHDLEEVLTFKAFKGFKKASCV